ncbi:hypothetical protein MSIMFI_03722 [Mycobacterium simulans]|nr:hypothetical protein MSIMFI_03722 [Mycobacterium simulans]
MIGSITPPYRPAAAPGVVRETARLLAAEPLRAPMRLAFWLFPSASSRSAGPMHDSKWIEAKFHDGFS